VSVGKPIPAKPHPGSLTSSPGFSVHGMYELTKPRLSLLSVFTASLGYLVREPLQADWSIFICLTLGTALAAAGAAALNQWMEKNEDAQMARTASRPLPAGLVSPQFAVVFGIILSSIGLYILWAGTNPWATTLTLATLVVYLLLYTPMKKRSPYATEVGAISGALPPLIGWVAAEGAPTTYGWILFGILFTWQLPHFMAIAWNFRDDYSKGGFKLHQLGDPDGRALARKSLFYSVLLTAFVFSPYFLPLQQSIPGTFYLASALFLSLYLLIPALRFLTSANRDQSAKKLFFVTIIYLPLLFAALVIDRYL
jgi:protoheme IX farnesyltransferase